jgi:uncharacterized protein YjbI with pentapeptide repeats
MSIEELTAPQDPNIQALNSADIFAQITVLRGAADDAARNVRGLFLTFLLFAFYVAVIVFSTDDEQLLKQTGAHLPLLDIDLPLLGFYAVVPWLVLLFHAHLLSQHYLLSRKLRNLDDILHTLPQRTRRVQRELPFPLIFAHHILGEHYPRPIRWVFGITVNATLVVMPLLLLASMQWKFLPYHSGWITFVHQVVFTLDALLLWLIWPRIRNHGEKWQVRWQTPVIALVLAQALALIFIWLLLVPPGAGIEALVGKQAWLDGQHRNLTLSGLVLTSGEPLEELLTPQNARSGNARNTFGGKSGKLLELDGRDLRGADFSGAYLRGMNLSKAELQDADLKGANLQAARLDRANLRGAQLHRAKLQKAKLWKSHLENADLTQADLQVADLRSAHLEDADLVSASLQAADLRSAHLQGADLSSTKLQAADLRSAHLEGTTLRKAQLQDADLRQSRLEAADFREALFYGTNFRDAEVTLADFRDVRHEPVGPDGWPYGFGSDYLKQDDDFQNAKKRVWSVVFDLPMHSAGPEPLQGFSVMHDQTGLFGAWPAPPEEKVFAGALAAYLTGLACENADIARGVLRRADRLSDPILLGAIEACARTRNCEMLAFALSEARDTN